MNSLFICFPVSRKLVFWIPDSLYVNKCSKTGGSYVMSPTARATPSIYRASCHAFVESIFMVKQRTYSEIIC